jgi:hypothetical protein
MELPYSLSGTRVMNRGLVIYGYKNIFSNISPE